MSSEAEMATPEKLELADFERACAEMLGALEHLCGWAKTRNQYIGALPPRSVEIRTQNLRREIEGLYEHLTQGTIADDASADAELLLLGQPPLRAEDFDHFPPNRKSQA